VYQLLIVQCGTIIASALQRVEAKRPLTGLNAWHPWTAWRPRITNVIIIIIITSISSRRPAQLWTLRRASFDASAGYNCYCPSRSAHAAQPVRNSTFRSVLKDSAAADSSVAWSGASRGHPSLNSLQRDGSLWLSHPPSLPSRRLQPTPFA